MRILALAFVSALVAAPALAGLDRRVTPTSVGPARLGGTVRGYERSIGEPAYVVRLAGGIKRLQFAHSELSVTLDQAGHGVAVVTAAREYRTTTGVGPCAPVSRLLAAYRGQLREKRSGPPGRHLLGYRVGKLFFTVRGPRVGAVMLADPSVPVATAVNGPQCGEGEEG